MKVIYATTSNDNRIAIPVERIAYVGDSEGHAVINFTGGDKLYLRTSWLDIMSQLRESTPRDSDPRV